MDISVIIPIYNVEEFLVECLESVKRNVAGLYAEVLLIDDGSTDNSSIIARLYAEKLENFSYYRTENGGPSRARNYGVSLAVGKYISFIDSDDMLTEGILKKMFEAAERNGSELTVCNVARIKDKKITESYMHACALNKLTESISHITRHPDFVYDATICNKLILRSFYLRHNITFFDGYAYGDMLPNLKLHYFCNSVSVIYETGYLWRICTGANKQITNDIIQRMLQDKIDMMALTLKYAKKESLPSDIIEALETKFLTWDFDGWLNRLDLLPQDIIKKRTDLITDFVNANIDKEYIKELPLIHQQIYQDLLGGDISHLIQIVTYKNTNASHAPVIVSDNGLKMKLPSFLFTIPNRNAEHEFGNNSLPVGSVDTIMVDKRTVVTLQGHSYVKRVNIPFDGTVHFSTILINELSGKVVPLSITPVKTANVTTSEGKILNYDDYQYYQYNYDGAGFRIDIDFEQLTRYPELIGNNYIILSYDFTHCRGNWLLKGINGNAKKTAEKFIYENEKYRGEISFDVQNTIRIVLSIKENLSEENPGADILRKLPPEFNSTKVGKQWEKLLHKQLITLKKQHEKYSTLRVDIRNRGKGGCNVIEQSVTPAPIFIRRPVWLPDGITIESLAGTMSVAAQCQGDGELEIGLMGRDMRNAGGKRYPVWIDCTYFAVNGEVVFNETKTVCHDKRYVYRRAVKDGEVIRLDLAWTECQSSNVLDEYRQLQTDLKIANRKINTTEATLKNAKAENVKLARELKNIKNGWSFRAGRLITWLPSKIKELLLCFSILNY